MAHNNDPPNNNINKFEALGRVLCDLLKNGYKITERGLEYENNPDISAADTIKYIAQNLDRHYIRLPQVGKRCPISGLPRTTLYDLCTANKGNGYDPPVKSIVIKRKGAKRGSRLVDYNSLMAYLDQLAAEANLGRSPESM